MNKDNEGQWLFLFLAFPCACLRHLRGDSEHPIDPKDFIALEHCIISKQEPSEESLESLLKRAFPRAYPKLVSFAKKRSLELWDVETVRRFWQWHLDQVASSEDAN